MSTYTAPSIQGVGDRLAHLFGLPDASNITDCTAERFGDGPLEIRVQLTRRVDSQTASAILGMEVTP